LKSKNNLSSFLIIGILMFLINSCNIHNRKNFLIYSPDKKQCVIIITSGETRYIINGKHNSIPKSNYVKIDKSQIDPIGDEIGVCWKNENYDWQIVNHQSKILENKLDTTKFKFNTSWEKDERGIFNSKKYHKPYCGTIDLLNIKTYGEAIVLKN
jgi:hypothetical protein